MTLATRKAGITVDGRFYEFAGRLELGDGVLIERLTGLTTSEWAEQARLESEETETERDDARRRGLDPDSVPARMSSTTLTGMVAVAIRQGNPRWPLDRVVRLVTSIDFTELDTTAGDDDQAAGVGEVAAGPPSPHGHGSTSSVPAATGSDTASDSSSATPTPNDSGPPA